MPKLLFRFVKQAVSLAQKRCAASPTAVSDLTGHGFSGWKHVKLHILWVHMDALNLEIVIRRARQIAFVGFYSCHGRFFPPPQRCTGRSRGCPYSCGWILSKVRETLRSWLARSYRCHVLRPQNGIERLPTPLGSPHTHAENAGVRGYRLVAVLDLHYSAHWPHDTQTGRRIAFVTPRNREFRRRQGL